VTWAGQFRTPREYAQLYAEAGMSVVPIPCDGTKIPRVKWKQFQERIATSADIDGLFAGDVGLAIVNGKVSGNKETLDIDDPSLVAPFEAAVTALHPGLLDRLTIVATPRGNHGGRHLHYRVQGTVPGNTKLAQTEPIPQFNKDGTPEIDQRTGKQRLAPKTLIETRGEGGYTLVPGCPGACHESGLTYDHISGPPLTALSVISADEHQALWNIAQSFNRYVDGADTEGEATSAFELKPGDDFNTRATWEAILEPPGWVKVHSSGDMAYWRRPGKSEGWSATTGCKSKAAGNSLLCVFSSNAHPFDGPANGKNCSTYSKFAAFAVLNHRGDFTAAAKDLLSKGYGKPKAGNDKSKLPATAASKIKLPQTFQPFPATALPGPLSAFIREASRAIGCDSALVGLPLLAALAGCIGTTRRLRIKRTWYAPAVLWTAAVVDSGQQKSPAQGAVTRLLYERQGRDLKEHVQRLNEYQKQLTTYERDLSEWKRTKGAAKGEPPEKPQEPVCKRIILSDSTIEAVADRLNDNHRGLLLDRDELSGWLGSYDQYRGGKGSDVSHWLSCYHAKPLLIDRKTSTKKTIFVERAAVSITGGIQPRILARMLGKQHFENGLAARFGFAMPPRTDKQWSEATISEDTEEVLDWVYDWLLALRFAKAPDGSLVPIDLPLSVDGKEAFIEFYNHHGQEQAELTGDLAALWAKLEEVAARIALIIHLVRCAVDDTTLVSHAAVDASSIAAGVTLARWFGSEGQRIYTVLAETDEERVRRQLIELIQRKGGRITARDLSKSSRRYSDSELAEQALIELVAGGAGRWEMAGATPQGGRPTRVFHLAVGETPVEHGENRGFGYADSSEPAKNESEAGGEEDTEWTFEP
jgi:Protein of unknown function (DUF3987)/Bifunctional DNA primase/polymerase, N-terminal